MTERKEERLRIAQDEATKDNRSWDGLDAKFKGAYLHLAEAILSHQTEPPKEVPSEICPDCEGKGFKEYNAGLLQVECRACGGTGKTSEVVNDNTTDEGAGPDNNATRSPDTSKPKQPKKRKARAKARNKSS